MLVLLASVIGAPAQGQDSGEVTVWAKLKGAPVDVRVVAESGDGVVGIFCSPAAVPAIARFSLPVGSVYSPTHPLTVNRESSTSARALYLERDILPDRDFILYYSLTSEGVGLDFLAHNPPEEDGFFLLLLTPPAARDLPPLPKDLVLVIDRSGSIEGEKMFQARDAAAFILERLAPDDRGDGVRPSFLVFLRLANSFSDHADGRAMVAMGSDLHSPMGSSPMGSDLHSWC